jgi:hypothetical protein
MIIGCDIDGVLADFSGAYLKALQHTTGRGPAQPVIGRFPMWDWPERFGYTPEDTATVWKDIAGSINFWAGLHPFMEAGPTLATLFNLYQHGHPVYFLTNRTQGVHIHAQTMAWLMAYGFPAPQVLLCGDKGSVAKGLTLTHFIDDKPENCWEVKDARPECQVFLLRRFDECPEAEALQRKVTVITSCRSFF